MQHNRKNRICVLGAAVLLASCLTAGVGITYARESVPGAVTVLLPQTAPPAYSSDILSEDGRKVYLSDWVLTQESENQTQTGESELTDPLGGEPNALAEPEEANPSEPETPTRTVSFTVSDTTATAEVFTVVTDDNLQVSLSVLEGVVSLTLTPTEAAYALTEDTTSEVTVTWQGLSASFQVNLVKTQKPQPADTPFAEFTLSDSPKLLAFSVDGGYNDNGMIIDAAQMQPVSRLKYSSDGGSTWHMLYDTTVFHMEAPESGLVLLDLSDTTAAAGMTLRVQGMTGLSDIEPVPDAQVETNPILMEKTGSSVAVPVDTDWLGCVFAYELQMLTEKTGWQPVSGEAGPAVTQSDTGLTVSLPQRDNPVPAGSYRLVMRWNRDAQTVYESAVQIFVIYPMPT